MSHDILWHPSQEIINQANVTRLMHAHGFNSYDELVTASARDTEWFWNAAMQDLRIQWYRPYSRIKDESQGFPWTQWFVGGETNIVLNGLDQHLSHGHGNRTAFLWEGDDGETQSFTFVQWHSHVGRVANLFKSLGLATGDAVGLYMPMVPEMVFALYGCFKLGLVAVPIFSGFGPRALSDRLADAQAKVLVTADGGFRRGKAVAIKRVADEALASVPSITQVVVVRRSGQSCPMKKARDLWWHEVIPNQSPVCETVHLPAEATALIIYTSGTTGKPKGTVHTHAGCLAQMVKEVCYYFDVKPSDHFFWVTDIGWMMGPWEIIGVSTLGGSFLIYEGTPNHPAPDRLWQVVERHRVSILGVSPTAIRLLKTYGDEWLTQHDLSSLRLLGSTGEPWDPESYQWYFDKVGGSRCPVINISGGTEIVGCHLAPAPVIPLKSCTLGRPGLGMDVDVFNEEGKSVRGAVGYLVCKKPAPSMTKGFLHDAERYLETYFSKWPNVWNHGDWAYVDADGFWFLRGRSDDTIKVAGKRTGPAEIEAALIEHQAVAEAAAIGIPDALKGEVVVCFVVLKPNTEASPALVESLQDQVVLHLGKTLRPQEIHFVQALPKTRSAKIVRGAIKKKFLGQEVGDLASVENPEALNDINPVG